MAAEVLTFETDTGSVSVVAQDGQLWVPAALHPGGSEIAFLCISFDRDGEIMEGPDERMYVPLEWLQGELAGQPNSERSHALEVLKEWAAQKGFL